MQTRLEHDQARHDTRDWVQERRARTRQLIELGGLVQKVGLVELTGNDRATLLGALLDLASQLQGTDDADPRTSAHAGDASGCAPLEPTRKQPRP